MPDDINPFEPWRPRNNPDDRRREEEARRMWREPEREPEPEWYRQPRAPEPAWTPHRESQGGSAGFIWLSIALLVAALITWAVNGGNHVSRVGAAFLAVWLGLLLAWPVGRGWRWYARLGLLAVGLVGAVACWMWVPTTGGVNLWHAQAVLERTRNLPPGDLTAYANGTNERNEVSREFSRMRNDLRNAESVWYGNTVNTELNQAERERGTDPVAALARLKKLDSVLTGSEHYRQYSGRIHQARRSAMESRLTQLVADLEALTRKGQFSAVTRQAKKAQQDLQLEAQMLSLDSLLKDRLTAVRQGNLRAQIEAAHTALTQLARAGKHIQVGDDGRRLTADLLPEAVVLGLQNEVDQRLLPLRQDAIRIRIRTARDDLEALVKKGEHEAVPKRAATHEKELDDEARSLNVSRPGLEFLPPRRTALARRADKAVKVLEGLLQKKEYAAVASRGADLMRELGPEARASGAPGNWGAGLVAVRRKAFEARLDQARVEARELLKQDRYQARAKAADRAYANLALEAELVGMTKELLAFRDRCRFDAKLAEQANIEDRKPAKDK
jgi:hypothetical protein